MGCPCFGSTSGYDNRWTLLYDSNDAVRTILYDPIEMIIQGELRPQSSGKIKLSVFDVRVSLNKLAILFDCRADADRGSTW